MFKSATPTLTRIDGKFHWQFADGTLLKAITGGATATDTTVPADLSELDEDALTALRDEQSAEFDRLRDEGSRDLPVLTALADDIDRLNVAIAERQAETASTDAEIEALAARVHPADATDTGDGAGGGDEGNDGGEGDGADGTDSTADADAAVTAAAGGRQRPGLGDVARRAPASRHRRPNATPRVAITAAADLAEFTRGTGMTLDQVAVAMHEEARNLGESFGRKQRVARFHVPQPHQLGTDPAENAIAIAAALGNFENDAPGLVAAGGWCAPSVPIFEMFDMTPDTADLFDLPGLGQDVRAGVMVPTFYDIGDVGGAYWTWTEAADVAALTAVTAASASDAGNVLTINTTLPHGLKVGNTVIITGATPAQANGTFTVATVVDADTFTVPSAGVTDGAVTGLTYKTTKGCLRIPCPTWTESRLEGEGLCVTHGNLQDRAWPELTRNFVGIVMAGHLRRLSAAKIAKVLADSVTVTPNAGLLPSDVAGDLLNVLELAAADLRSEFRVGRSRSVDVVLPSWIINVLRSNMAMRHGIDPSQAMNIPDSAIVAWLTARGIRPQFTPDWQPLFNAAPSTNWPANVTFLMFFTGAYISLDGGTIDLGVTRDSTLNATNDYTAAWSEQFYQVVRRGPQARQYTLAMQVNGTTGPGA